MADLRSTEGIENPHHFDSLMNAIYERREVPEELETLWMAHHRRRPGKGMQEPVEEHLVCLKPHSQGGAGRPA